MKMRLLVAFGWIWFGLSSSQAHAVESVYVGAQVGHVSLSGTTANTFSNAIGFGVELGLEASHLFNVTARFGYSSHSGGAGLSLYHPTLSADFFLARYSEFTVTLGGGPGFYFFDSGGATESNFGLNVGIDGDVTLTESTRVGLGWRYHGVMGGVAGSSFFTIMMRLGFVFDTDS